MPVSPAPFHLVGGHPALDLVNTYDDRFLKNPVDLLPTYADVLRFCLGSKVIGPGEADYLGRKVKAQKAEMALHDGGVLREALSELLYDIVDGNLRVARGEERGAHPRALSVGLLGQKANEAYEARRLEAAADGKRLEWVFGKTEAHLPVWRLALAGVELLISEDLDRVRSCENADCRWLFLDNSKNHSRRWCEMKVCGNRMKSRRFKARR